MTLTTAALNVSVYQNYIDVRHDLMKKCLTSKRARKWSKNSVVLRTITKCCDYIEVEEEEECKV